MDQEVDYAEVISRLEAHLSKRKFVMKDSIKFARARQDVIETCRVTFSSDQERALKTYPKLMDKAVASLQGTKYRDAETGKMMVVFPDGSAARLPGARVILGKKSDEAVI